MPPDLIGASVAINRDFLTIALRHSYQPNSKFYTESTLIQYINRFYIDGSIGQIKAKLTRNEGYSSFRNDSNWELFKNYLSLDFGFNLRNRILTNKGSTLRVTDPLNPNPNPYKTDPPDFEQVPVNDKDFTPNHNAYMVLNIKHPYFEFYPGVRYEYFGLQKQEVVDPRGTFSINITKEFQIIGGGGIYHLLPKGNQYSKTSGNPYLTFEKASHSSGGISV